MVRANLRNANLFGADLTGVRSQRGYSADADMRGVAMSDAKLVRTDLTRVDLREGMLMTSCAGEIRQSQLRSVTTMGKAQVVEFKARKGLSSCFLRKANLRNSDLNHANLTRANLAKADLRGCNTRGSDLTGTNLAGANSSKASF